MTIEDLINKTNVFLGAGNKPKHTISLINIQSDVGAAFLVFSEMENNDGVDFGDELETRPCEDKDPDRVLDAILFANEKAWDNFVYCVNKCNEKYKKLREDQNEGLQA